MATEYLFANNATTTLAQSISATSTVLNVASGGGSLFPSPAAGQAFAVTLVDAATGLTNEICYCTSRSGDQLTVSRGQEGTNATTWAAGDTCANYITADVMESWLQESDLNGYATQSWSNSAFVKNNNGTDGGIVSADMDASGVPSFLSGKGTWYPVRLKDDYSEFASGWGANGYIEIPTANEWKFVQQWVQFQGTTGTGGNLNGVYETDDIFVTWPLGMQNILRVAGLSVEDVGGVDMNEKVWAMVNPTATGGSFRLSCSEAGVTMTGSALIIGSVAS